MTFGQQIQQHRRNLGISQDALAQQLYVTRQSVSQWENDRTMPSVDLLVRLAELFGTTVDGLLGKESEPAPPIAEAPVLRGKKAVFAAVGAGYFKPVSILLSVSALFGLLTALVELLFRTALSPRVYSNHIAYYQSHFIIIYRAVALGSLAAALVLCAVAVIAAVRCRRASVSAERLRFFADRLELHGAQEPLGLFYSNVRHITERDFYLYFRMQNGARLCVDKRQLEGDGEALAALLRGCKNYRDRRVVRRDPCPYRAASVLLLQLLRDLLFVFVLGSYTLRSDVMIYTMLQGGTPAAARWLLFLLPVLLDLGAIGCGVIFLIKKIKGLRLIIAGGIFLVALTVLNIFFLARPHYSFQNHRVTPEEFTASMEAHGLEVRDTLYGRQETFITTCLTASPKNGTYEILYLGFDDTSGDWGLQSAYQFYQERLAESSSQFRISTATDYMSLAFNAYQRTVTNNFYSYDSLNEYTVICFTTTPEKAQEVQQALQDFELEKP